MRLHGPPRDHGSQFRAAFFGKIDCGYLANSLDILRRDQFMIKTSLLLDRLYDSFSHCILTAKNKRIMKVARPGESTSTLLSAFPRTQNQFNGCCKAHFMEAGLDTQHLKVKGGTFQAVRTVGELQLKGCPQTRIFSSILLNLCPLCNSCFHFCCF
jgi:hypothetical protein